MNRTLTFEEFKRIEDLKYNKTLSSNAIRIINTIYDHERYDIIKELWRISCDDVYPYMLKRLDRMFPGYDIMELDRLELSYADDQILCLCPHFILNGIMDRVKEIWGGFRYNDGYFIGELENVRRLIKNENDIKRFNEIVPIVNHALCFMRTGII